MFAFSSLGAGSCIARFFGQTNAQTHTKGNSKDDEDDDQRTPPLELATSAGMVVGDLYLLVALFDVVYRVDGIGFGSLDDGFLLLDKRGELLVKNTQFP